MARLMKLVSLMAAVDAASCHGLLLLLSVHYYNTIPCTMYILQCFLPPKRNRRPKHFFYNSTIFRLPKEINLIMKEGKVSKLFGSIISQVAVDASCLPMPC